MEGARYVLRLYVAGNTPYSLRAIANLRAICAEHLAGRHELRVVDVYQHPYVARRDQIIALPTLIKERPLPLRRIIGDLSDLRGVLHGLGLSEEHAAASEERHERAR